MAVTVLRRTKIRTCLATTALIWCGSLTAVNGLDGAPITVASWRATQSSRHHHATHLYHPSSPQRGARLSRDVFTHARDPHATHRDRSRRCRAGQRARGECIGIHGRAYERERSPALDSRRTAADTRSLYGRHAGTGTLFGRVVVCVGVGCCCSLLC